MKLADLEIVAAVETITPQIAKDLLTRNTHNRPKRINTVKTYAAQMLDGDWRLNGEPIIIDSSGDILDGQHRLEAIVLADVSIQSLMVRGIARDTFGTIDTGRTRNGADVLAIEGLDPSISSTCAAAAGHCLSLIHTRILHRTQMTALLTTPEKRRIFVNDNPRLIDLAEAAHSFGRLGRVIPSSATTALWLFMEARDKRKTESFFNGFLSGANLDIGDPRLVLRNRIDVQKTATAKWSIVTKMHATIRAWDWFLRGKPCLQAGAMLTKFETAVDVLLPYVPTID